MLQSEFPRCNCINKAACLLKGKCQYECLEYKIEVYNNGSNNNNNDNRKKVYAGSTQGAFKKDIIIEVVSAHDIYRHRSSLSNYV